MKYLLSLFFTGSLVALSASAVEPPAPYGALPSKAQLAWHEMETYAFVHFTMNTFTGKEWGYGDEDPKLFNPTAFDADQIVGVLAEAGMKGVILTCKHHDGFCLWPTKTTQHSIAASPWKNGQGDMVREFADAAKKHGIRFGVYLSPWDRNNEHYGTPQYIEIYREQLRELLSNYGPVFSSWYDGANGGDGYYGGKRERRNIDRIRYYDWPNTWKIVRERQPDAVIFSDIGPDVRWIGNEKGYANYPCWATYDPVGPDGGEASAPGYVQSKRGTTGTVDGTKWMPGECDVSIRPGWFFHEHENNRVRSPHNLLNLYFQSVGRGASLLLNVPPDKRGQLHENDVKALRGYKSLLDEMYSKNLAEGATVTADSTRGAGFEPSRVLDGNKKTYWATVDNARAATLTLSLPEARIFNVIKLREPIELGQRIRRFEVDVRIDGTWLPWITQGSSIGAHTLLKNQRVLTDGVRLRILESAACPLLSEVSLWLAPEGEGETTKANPHRVSTLGWKVSSSFETSDHPAIHAIDGNPRTFWCTHDRKLGEKGPPQSITVDMGHEVNIAAVTFLPRQDGTIHAVPDRYRLEWSLDGKAWSKPLEGEFSNIRANPIEQHINLPEGSLARHIRFTVLSVLERDNVTVAEIGVIRREK